MANKKGTKIKDSDLEWILATLVALLGIGVFSIFLGG